MVKICKNCRKEIIKVDGISNHNYQKKKFCTHKCYGIWIKGISKKTGERKLPNKCLFCGKEHYNQHFCSRTCEKNKALEKYPNKRCLICNKEIVKGNISLANWKTRLFCNKKCYVKYNGGVLGWTNKKIKLKSCIVCGNKIEKNNESSKEWKKRKFCSRQCLNGARLGKTRIQIFGEEKAKEIDMKTSKENSANWRGGIGNYPYDYNFNKNIKKEIKKRFNHLCFLCGDKIIKNPTCHHIHYRKEDSRLQTLVLLDERCHGKTNFNRDYWFAYFCKKLKIEPWVVLA